jgi:branched-chain amino acid transport system substrate-binding protein
MAEGGQQFGKYHILDELGRGGFATVYKAVDTTLDREVALKILHPPLLTDRRFVQNFRLEAKTLAALRHPHIITVYEVGEVDGRLFIAMDLAHGLSLARSIAERGRITWNETLALLKPVSEALDYAHGQKVVHRDLKPANLLLDAQRGALLTDFGFARLMAENSASMSMSGGIVGTPGYIAPEVWEENAASPPVDIYALGCIAYEMLTGDVLFKGQTPIQAMRAHDRGPQFPATWLEDVPAGITEVLGKALARDPAARYPSAGALWHALNDLEDQAQAAREAAQRAALAAQWRAEAEKALAEKSVMAARMALGRWRAIAPGDTTIGEVQARLERLSAPPPVEAQPGPSPQSKPVAQDRVLADILERTTGPTPVPPNEVKIPAKAPPTRATQLESSPRVWHSGQIVGGAIGLIVMMFLVGVLITNNPFSDRSGVAPTVVPTEAAPAPTSKATPKPTKPAASTTAPVAPTVAADSTNSTETALPSGATAAPKITAVPVVVGTIKIISSLPRTGSSKGQTDSVVNAINQRLAEDNNQACNGQFKIEYEDLDDATAASGRWDPTQEADNANKAVADLDVMVYIGTFNSGAAKVSIPILNAADLVMISPANSYPGLTKPGKGVADEPERFYPTGKRNYTRIVPADDVQGIAGANWAKELGVKSIYILHDTETYGKGVADVFRARAQELGLEEKGYEGIDMRAQDYTGVAAQIRDSNPDLVYFGGITQNNAGLVLKDLRASGYAGKFMGPDGIYEGAFLEAAGDAAEGTYVTFGVVPPAKLTGKGREWYDAYKAKFNSEPQDWTVYGYEATSVALAAINKVCTKDRAAILDAVFATRDFDGVLGKWSFDAHGDTSLTNMSGVQVIGGKFDTANTTVLK